jgi:hypothetical protein
MLVVPRVIMHTFSGGAVGEASADRQCARESFGEQRSAFVDAADLRPSLASASLACSYRRTI